jgi:hypothetical protein
MNIINPTLTRPSPGFFQTSNQDLIPVNQPLGQLSLERTQNQNFVLVNQVLRRLSVDGITSQEITVENINFLIDGMLDLQELAKSQASELLRVKKQLRVAELRQLEAAQALEAYKTASNEMAQALSEKVDVLQQKFLALKSESSRQAESGIRFAEYTQWRQAELETLFTAHRHSYYNNYGANSTTSVPNNAVVPEDSNFKFLELEKGLL